MPPAASPPPIVRGVALDPQTRCAHYHSPLDIIAIRMACCGTYYACKDCHEELSDHPSTPWPRDRWEEPAVLCGACRQEMSVAAYLACGFRCPDCDAAFNPGCRNHYHLYFEV